MDQFEIVKEINKKDGNINLITDILFQYLSRKKADYLPYEAFKEKEIQLISDFLNGKPFDKKKYDKLTLKLAKKWEKKHDAPEIITGIALWLAENHKNYNHEFYNNLKKFLFDAYPTFTTNEYIYETRKAMELPNDLKVREAAFKKHNIPVKAFLTFLTSKYSDHYDAMMSGQCVTSYKEFLKILKKMTVNNFDTLTEVMDIITPKAQLKLLDLMLEKEEEKTINYILNELAEKTTANQVAQKIIYILEKKAELKEDVIKLLNSKKKPAREIAVALLIKWKLPENKTLLKPLTKDKSQKVVDMVSDFLATI